MQYHIDMSRMDKLIAKLLRFPNTMRFSDVEKVLNAHGYEETVRQVRTTSSPKREPTPSPS